MDNNDLSVTNEEIVEYLKVTYAVLKESKSTIDLVRLKDIIEILKKDKSKKYTPSSTKVKIKPDVIINLLAKQRVGADLSIQEVDILNKYFEGKFFLRMVDGKRFSELYSYLLKNEKELSTSDLTILYFCLTGQEMKTKKKEELLRGVSSYLSQKLYFDNMDDRYNNNTPVE